MIFSISAEESLKEGGDHLSNFSEYKRTALSPSCRMESMTEVTMAGTLEGALLVEAAVLVEPDLRCRAIFKKQVTKRYVTLKFLNMET